MLLFSEISRAPPTTVIGEVSNQSKPTLSPGRIVELRGPAVFEEGTTLMLTCLVSPVVYQVSGTSSLM